METLRADVEKFIDGNITNCFENVHIFHKISMF